MLAIISDIHDNLANLKKFLSWCAENKIEKLICCGDMTNSETLEFLAGNFSGEIFLVRGNIELYEEEEIKKYSNINYDGRLAGHSLGDGRMTIFSIKDKKIGLCHEPFLIEEIFKKASGGAQLGRRNDLDIIFYGHTHKPWISERAGVKIINPGTLGGVFSAPTFALWDPESGKIELKLLNDL